jgi:hypothetical protein
MAQAFRRLGSRVTVIERNGALIHREDPDVTAALGDLFRDEGKIHDCSPRKAERFLVVPCGALSTNLVESEFFGHTKGAFTGADRPKVGKFAAAGNGTLLLDEIDSLGFEQQANLLRVIETGEYEPVGSNETQICTARIIAASNWNLDEAVERGKFRRDLYYRLNVMSFHLPRLRERVQDIAPLVRGMAARFSTKFHKALLDISIEAMGALEAFPWPGNIRQLENVVQQAVLVSSGPQLLLQHLPAPVQDVGVVSDNGDHNGSSESLFHNREIAERSIIQGALVSSGYSRTRAANALGISRVTLYKKMKKYGLMDDPLQSSKAKAEKKTKTKPDAGEKKLSAINAAYKVLADTGKAMNCQELIAAMTEMGLWTSPHSGTCVPAPCPAAAAGGRAGLGPSRLRAFCRVPTIWRWVAGEARAAGQHHKPAPKRGGGRARINLLRPGLASARRDVYRANPCW